MEYDEKYWEELPFEVQDAARVLGYTEEIWDGDRTPEEMDCIDWEDLSQDKQQAARMLGYTATVWNETHGTETRS